MIEREQSILPPATSTVKIVSLQLLIGIFLVIGLCIVAHDLVENRRNLDTIKRKFDEYEALVARHQNECIDTLRKCSDALGDAIDVSNQCRENLQFCVRASAQGVW